MLSMMVPSSLQKIILLCFPINSTMRSLWHKSPSSSKCSISNWIIRSSPGWEIFVIRPFPICFLKTMQKLGAVMGLGLFLSVRYKKGREALADIARRCCPPGLFSVNRSSSFSGWAILLILLFIIFWFNSWTRFATAIPSNAIA